MVRNGKSYLNPDATRKSAEFFCDMAQDFFESKAMMVDQASCEEIFRDLLPNPEQPIPGEVLSFDVDVSAPADPVPMSPKETPYAWSSRHICASINLCDHKNYDFQFNKELSQRLTEFKSHHLAQSLRRGYYSTIILNAKSVKMKRRVYVPSLVYGQPPKTSAVPPRIRN